MGVHLGLIGLVATRDELASVLAHELSHITQRHIARLNAKQAAQAPWMLGAMILGALAASKNPEAANAVIAGGQAVSAQNQLNFSRDMEREADRIGFGVMADAGFDTRGVGSMFEKLQQASRLGMLGELAASIAHEVNQPLGAILSNADAAAMSDIDGREIWLLAPIAAVVLWMGVYPESFLQPIRRDVATIVERIERATPPSDSKIKAHDKTTDKYRVKLHHGVKDEHGAAKTGHAGETKDKEKSGSQH